MDATIHAYGTDGTLTQHGITDRTDLTAGCTAYDHFMVLTIKHEGSEFQVFDSTNGKFMLRIADAIMTALQEQEALTTHEAETFNQVSLA
jgi:hypothetical protein